MIKALKRINEGLPALIGGMVVYSILVEVVGIWFTDDKVQFTVGLLIGSACGIWMAINIASVLLDTVQLGANPKMVAAKAALRYIIIATVLVLMMVFHIGSLISAFLGVFGLKISAYAQPFIHKFILKDMDDDVETEQEVTMDSDVDISEPADNND
ncbi:MAG: hypothetical protein K5851_03080 [Lachnospiraceae bacterium]|nr:hypothetical protein [Lachnospiraceae bacterium]